MPYSRSVRCLVGSLALFFAGCTVEKLAPHQVSMGVARLTVRNSAVVTQAINDDLVCGFASTTGVRSLHVEGAQGQMGRAIWTVDRCQLAWSQPTTVLSDCNGITTQAVGTVFVSGTKTLEGVVTGDAKNPVIPVAPDAASFNLKVDFQKMKTHASNSRAYMFWNDGSVTFTAKPHLAVNASQGVCSVPLTNLSLSKVTYAKSGVTVDDGTGHHFDATVDSSEYDAQVGVWGDRENALKGMLSVWGTNLTLPSDGKGLDPEYNAVDFVKSYACTLGLQQPVSFVCPSVQMLESQGTARLAVSTMGHFLSYLDTDTVCGFQSPNVTASPAITGSLGDNGGTVVYTMPACTLHFPARTVLETDCYGREIAVQGDITVTGTKTVQGIITGSSTTPVVPTSWEPAQYQLRYDFSNFTFSDRADRRISYATGSATSTLTPHTEQDTTTGACSMGTPVLHVEHLQLKNSKITISKGDVTLGLTVQDSDYEAQNGAAGGRSNMLLGRITANGQDMQLPSDPAQAVLDPEYDAASFLGAYLCKAHSHIPQKQSECDMSQVLGENAARLLVQNAAMMSQLAANDHDCGFELDYLYNHGTFETPNGVLLGHSITGSGDQAVMSMDVSGACEVVQHKLSTLPKDCVGDQFHFTGSARFTGTANVTGRTSGVLCVLGICLSDAAFPISPDHKMLLNLAADVTEYAAYKVNAGANAPAGKLTLHTGHLSPTLQAITGQRASHRDRYDVATPLAHVTSLAVSGTTATLEANGLTFNLNIPFANLQAFNGSYQGQSNWLSGQIQLGESLVNITSLALDPSFDQTHFDESYACTQDLVGTVH